MIKSFVGIGGNNYGQVAKVAGANLTLNTMNNFGTSAFEGRFNRDLGINSMKIVTGSLGLGFGSVGGNIIGGSYGNGMDAYLNNANDNYWGQ